MCNKRSIQDFLVITVGTGIIAAAVYFFMLPGHVTVGSASALAMVIGNFVPLPVSVITMGINIVLLILGYLFIGKDFAFKTIYATILFPVLLYVLEVAVPNVQSLTGDQFLDMLGYIFVVGIGLALMFSKNASTGGIEVVAKLMNKYMRMDLGQAMSLSGMLVAVSAIFCYDTKTVFLSVLGTYLGGLIVDNFIFGLNPKRRVCILSPKVEEITHYILHELHSGASLYDAIGAYDHTVRREIVTIVDHSEYKKLMDYMRKTDPKAFITVYSVNEICYQPK